MGHNQMVIAENDHSKGLSRRKAGRGGQSLLTGLLRCRRCGRMLQVSTEANAIRKSQVPWH